jgi:2-methylaconitate cis-trans-isomerase PrpF
LKVGIEARQDNAAWVVTTVKMSQSARQLMKGRQRAGSNDRRLARRENF